RIYYRLLTDRFDPWMDRFNVEPGPTGKRDFERQKRNARIILLFLSSNASGKSFQREIDATMERLERAPGGSFHVIPVRLDESRIQNRVLRLEPIDVFSPGGWGQLVRRIEHDAESTLRMETDVVETKNVAQTEEEDIVPGNVADDPWKGQFG